MRTMQYQNARYRLGVATPVCMKSAPRLGLVATEDWVAAAMDALDGIENIVSNKCFDHPDTLTQDGITAYALALLRLRECAPRAADFERLRKACDALAVTVSRLIENKNCACPEKCAALTRFVAHARAMIQMHSGSTTRHTMPTPVPLPTGQSMGLDASVLAPTKRVN